MAKNNMTAVEWFFEVLAHNDIIDHKKLCVDENLYNLLYSLKNQAKQMEKEQAFQLFKAGQDSMEEGGKNFEQYYGKYNGNKLDKK